MNTTTNKIFTCGNGAITVYNGNAFFKKFNTVEELYELMTEYAIYELCFVDAAAIPAKYFHLSEEHEDYRSVTVTFKGDGTVRQGNEIYIAQFHGNCTIADNVIIDFVITETLCSEVSIGRNFKGLGITIKPYLRYGDSRQVFTLGAKANVATELNIFGQNQEITIANDCTINETRITANGNSYVSIGSRTEFARDVKILANSVRVGSNSSFGSVTDITAYYIDIAKGTVFYHDTGLTSTADRHDNGISLTGVTFCSSVSLNSSCRPLIDGTVILYRGAVEHVLDFTRTFVARSKKARILYSKDEIVFVPTVKRAGGLIFSMMMEGGGSEGRQVSFFKSDKNEIYVFAGCFFGTIQEFRECVRIDCGGDTQDHKYLQYIGFSNIVAVSFGRSDLVV